MTEHDDGTVVVVYALAERQWLVDVPFTAGMTALEAVASSKLLEQHPEIERRPVVLGLYGIEIEHHRVLEPGDRVEICRPLQEDPREMRRHAIEAGRVMGQPDD